MFPPTPVGNLIMVVAAASCTDTCALVAVIAAVGGAVNAATLFTAPDASTAFVATVPVLNPTAVLVTLTLSALPYGTSDSETVVK